MTTQVRQSSSVMNYEPEFGVDWLTAKSTLEADVVRDFLAAALMGDFDPVEGGSRFYRRRAVGPCGASISWEPKHGKSHVSVNLPGKACDFLGTEKLVRLSLTLSLIPSRVDLRFDHVPFGPHSLFDAFGAGDVNTHVKRTGSSVQFIASFEEEPQEGCTPELDTTVYLGAPASDTRLRCYDKRRTDEGYRVTRLELQLRRKRAAMFWDLTVNPGFDDAEQIALNTLAPLAVEVICSHVDFVDRESDTNISRCDRLAWWDEFCSGCVRTRLSIQKPQTTVEGLTEWCETMAPAFFAYAMLKLKEAHPAKFKSYIDSKGKRRLDPAMWGAWRSVLANFGATGQERAKGKHWAIVNSYKPDISLTQSL